MRSAHPTRFLTLAHSRFSLSSSHFRFLSSSHSLPTTTLSPPLSLSSPPSSMAEAVDNTDTIANSLSSSSAADDVEFGFKRPEMYKEKLAGTVDPPFDRHVFLCYGSYDSWPSRVESSDSDPLPKLLSGALKTRKNEIGVKTRLTVCEGREGTEFSDGDVLIFPEMIKYRGLKDSDVDSFVEDVIVSGKPWASGVPEVLAGSHVFVCAHANRDKRCGVCGPVLIEKFQEEIETRGLKDQVFVSACSHIGGHKYAGNIIIFSPDAEGKIAGHWYGYVTPDDVPEMLDQHIGKGEIIDRLWRGQMGVYVEPAEKAKEQKIPNGKDEKSKKKHKGEKKVQVENGVVASCCQGANGVSCCQDGSSEAKETAEVKGKKGLGKCSSWMGKWEQSEVLTAVGVVGAVATIAVAYSFYRSIKKEQAKTKNTKLVKVVNSVCACVRERDYRPLESEDHHCIRIQSFCLRTHWSGLRYSRSDYKYQEIIGCDKIEEITSDDDHAVLVVPGMEPAACEVPMKSSDVKFEPYDDVFVSQMLENFSSSFFFSSHQTFCMNLLMLMYLWLD
ncbi:hypothetical protein RHMOL_Rhmol10G0023200 [Rhododendron molle]|uniref:Uncharacterized protein n=1 Tax=Rhododendron molle TaxID=49168 RepID=A0ACC0LXV2_RHOML|nr:hypothetical protein RHMOL_Rhmol10G0023200 [Rhododendron molle]